MKKQICIWATQEEVSILEQLKEKYQRNTFSDTLRFLIRKEGDIFLMGHPEYITSPSTKIVAYETKIKGNQP